MSGSALLSLPSFDLSLKALPGGALELTGRIDSDVGWRDGVAELRFTMPRLDQTFLRPAIDALEDILEMEPIAEEE